MKINDFILSISDGLSDIWGMRKRAQRDQDRHKQKIKDAVKGNLKELINQEDIISTDGAGKKIKIPMKYLDQYRFKYGKNNKKQGVGHGGKDLKPGDIIHSDDPADSSQPGDKSGELVYEEFELDEVIDMMMEDLDLPWLEDKPEKAEIEDETIIYNDISKKGPMSNLDIRRTLKENLKRNASNGNAKIGNFNQDDLRFKTYNIKTEYCSNASIYLVMDRSGSMTTDKKYIAKSFFFWMVQFIKKKYKNIELVFIMFDVEAYICDEHDFFNISEGGGTKCSSGFDAALRHIKHYHPKDSWNNYVFSFSDGDNMDSDNLLCVAIVQELLKHVNAIGYGEITLNDWGAFLNNSLDGTPSSLHHILKKNVDNKKFMSALISKKEDVYSCLKQFFGLKSE